MSSDTDDQRLARRVAELSISDPQFAAARPSAAVASAIEQAGASLPAVIEAAMVGYADRPAMGRRVLRFVSDAQSGRTSLEQLPEFETITYRELWDHATALSNALTEGTGSVSAGDRVAVLGFTSVDYATVDLALGRIGAVSVPLQSGAAITQLQPVVVETEAAVIAASLEYLSDAVELILGGHTPARLVVFDYHPQVDDHREAFEDARARLADTEVDVETLDNLIERGRALPVTPAAVSGAEDPAEDPLSLLIYTSGSTGAPKGAMYPQSNAAGMWNRSSGIWFGESAASITANFMPMSHVMGRAILYGTLG
ncbi:MAG: AMP-binding protein, partial [Actinomycetia bacterium]|nr:AMP-binding protein [Actinomycetes bacterium]